MINNYFTYDLKNHARSVEIMNAIDYSSRAFERAFSNDVTVNIQYQLGYSSSYGLGQSATSGDRVRKDRYADWLRASSAANPANTVLAQAVASLSVGNLANPDVEWIQFESAQARALGIAIQGDLETWGPPDDPYFADFGGDSLPEGQGLDGSVKLMSLDDALFGTDIPWSEMPKYDESVGLASWRFAAINTIQHEIMHVLGGGNALVLPGVDQITGLDLYRYTAPGVANDGNEHDTAYFSVDGGKTNIQYFNSDNFGDPGGWGPTLRCPTGYGRGGPIGLFMDAVSCGNQPTVTLSLDSPEGIQMMALGWNPRVAAVPEPATWTMMLLGFGGIGAALRRRRPRVAVRIDLA
ncbi:NF038122 family metalloprotease [Sphingomonas sp. Tas61C01]|uniref:NF038122 family metalloprotease n=1 Tax=Sphingomonas sp. Tas61C01 TaxID=3458297 RepID=UPI00403EB36F